MATALQQWLGILTVAGSALLLTSRAQLLMPVTGRLLCKGTHIIQLGRGVIKMVGA